VEEDWLLVVLPVEVFPLGVVVLLVVLLPLDV